MLAKLYTESVQEGIRDRARRKGCKEGKVAYVKKNEMGQ